ncbi:MAG: DUF4345 family protein [Polymorphobacter sp.]|uniref:DUF4345 family protein n=1 Tax=Polymorphobacter sp. TaxID=1909290 RepID=UPI003A85391B
MRQIMRITVGLLGLFNLAIGLAFLIAPAAPAEAFFLAPQGTQGLATLRADMPGFFITAASFALLGAWRADPRPLAVPLAMLAIALTGRSLSLALDGAPDTAFPPMIAEAVMIAILLTARRAFRA